MFSKGCHVIGENSLKRELDAERRRRTPIVPERTFSELCNSAPRIVATRRPRGTWRLRGLRFR